MLNVPKPDSELYISSSNPARLKQNSLDCVTAYIKESSQ